MKITEATTFAELREVRKELGEPFITIMSGTPGDPTTRHAIAHLPGVGTFHGSGATEAEALDIALDELRRHGAMLKEILRMRS